MLPAVSIRIHSGGAVPDKQARAVSSIERCNPEPPRIKMQLASRRGSKCVGDNPLHNLEHRIGSRLAARAGLGVSRPLNRVMMMVVAARLCLPLRWLQIAHLSALRSCIEPPRKLV